MPHSRINPSGARDLDLGHDLRIKYGLTDDPSAELIVAWAERTSALAVTTGDPEQAGRRAAREVFGELDGILYFSAADTIEALLARARSKEDDPGLKVPPDGTGGDSDKDRGEGR